MAFNFQNWEIFLLSLIINDNPGKKYLGVGHQKYKKNTKTLSTFIKCITKKNYWRKFAVLAGLME